MNILIPDIWLRDYLITPATPKQIKEYLSLCGPSVERIYGKNKKTVYDIEITGNRPDAMSVMGVAREAATILPKFGIEASLVGDPYAERTPLPKTTGALPLRLETDPILNPRWMSVIFDKVTVTSSPKWLQSYLELAGMRSLNNVVDITNYLMRAYGQPAHVFDYDLITGHTMTLRASKKGEKLITLDGKSHTLPGGDIVIEDHTGKLIDLCGIMGGENSAVTANTKRVILFLQTYDSAHIRKTSMALGHRTEAAGLFEKGLDTELVKPTIMKGIRMMADITKGVVASKLTDMYPSPFIPYTVSVSRTKIQAYIGQIDTATIQGILESLGMRPTITKETVTVTVPSWRRDIVLDVDVIEEIARIYGYHTIAPQLPDTAPPLTRQDPALLWEEEIKIRLRDWGYTELYTYSMLSEDQMNTYALDTKTAYKITNPLSSEWVYMRPALWPGVVSSLTQNARIDERVKLFELSMIYEYRKNDLPNERPVLVVAWNGRHFAEAKGIAEALFSLMGIASSTPISEFGTIVTKKEYTYLELYVDNMISRSSRQKIYTPIPKFPSATEDLAFVVPDMFAIGPLIDAFSRAHPLIASVSLLDAHEQTRTLHIEYQDTTKNLTNDDITPVRMKLIDLAKTKFGITLRQS